MLCHTACARNSEKRRGVRALEFVGRNLNISSLRKEIEASRLHSIRLASQFEIAATSTEKSKIAREFDKALKQTHAMQYLLEMLERKRASD